MKEYQVFPISNMRSGFVEAVEPWLLPRDGYQQMINAHLYRGIIERVGGYNPYAYFTNRYIQSLGATDGAKTHFTGTLSHIPVITNNVQVYGSLVIGSSSQIMTYDSDGVNPTINLSGSGGTGTLNTTTGAYVIDFATAPPASPGCAFIQYDVTPAAKTAIMGIKQYYNKNGSQEILVFDQKRVGKIVTLSGFLADNEDVNYDIQELPHDYYKAKIIIGDGVTTMFSGTLTGAPFVPGTLIITEFLASGAPTGRVLNDDSVGGITGTGVSSGTVNYVSGAFAITFAVAPANTNYFSATYGVYGNLFTGTISDFFSLTNYLYKAFFVNNVDPVFYYDGLSVHYLPTNTSVKVINATNGVPSGYDIITCLHVFTYRERLLLISVNVDGTLQLSTIYWSVPLSPLDFTNNQFLAASTSESIRAIGYINTDLVVRFTNSERVFRYTADETDPFRFDSTNNIWACDAPYSSINYDSWFSSVGRPAIVGSDAVNVKRVDEIIPDFTDPYGILDQTPVPYMSQNSIKQCYGERFDDIKEGWLCYNSTPKSETIVTASDNVLAFNYLDSTYAIYSFPFSCLGYGHQTASQTWGTTFIPWEQANFNWGSYQITDNALLDLAGDQYDTVFQLNVGNTQTVAGDDTQTPIPVLMSVITKNFNPFIEEGQLCRLGYVDIFVTANIDSTLRVQFYLNDELTTDSDGNPVGYYQESILKFAPTDAMSPTNPQTKVWKRVYVGAVGKEHTIRLYQNSADFVDTESQPIYIHALNIWMKPAGRIFN